MSTAGPNAAAPVRASCSTWRGIDFNQVLERILY